jgi:hypothetical protein
MASVKHAIQQSAAITHSSVSIRPFLSGKSNMGLEKYNLVIADGVKHRACISVLGVDRIKTYVTGLNEQSQEMLELKKESATNKEKLEEYEAKVKEIRQIVARAERELNGNYTLDHEDPNIVNDKEFWTKVRMFHSVVPDQFDEQRKRISSYWDDITLELDNHGQVLDERDIRDVLLIKIAEAGGFSLIAPSYETAAESGKYKFYLDKRSKSSSIKVSGRKLRDEAGSALLKLYKGDSNKLFYITKLVSLDSLYYRIGKNNTPLDVFYDDCSRYLDGEGIEKSKEEASKKFIEYCKLEMDELRLRCMVKDGTALRMLSYKPDGSIYYIPTGTPMGKTVPECIVFLKDPLNQDIYKALNEDLQKAWSE